MSSSAASALLSLLLFAAAVAVNAGTAAPSADDPRLEKRVNALAAELRCLVCQNQSLADSSAPLAVDLKNQIREKLARGESEGDVVDFMVARYGEFVLYRPPVKASTLILWLGPLLLLLIGLYVLYRRLKSVSQAAVPPLSPAERERAARLLTGTEEPRK